MTKRISFVAIAAMALCSCATIFTPSRYSVNINTSPDGANIKIENRNSQIVYEGVSPAVVQLRAAEGYMQREEYRITLSKDGYNSKVISITSSLDGWYLGNILIGGLIGMLVVDPASGAMYKIAKGDRLINENLTPKDLSLCIYDINNLPEHIDKSMLVGIR